jgi:predicted dehydrogenase
VIAHVNVNWLSPMKVRTTLLGGDRKMLVWNDLEPAEKLKIYDKGVEITSRQGIYDLLVSYRSGDMWAPRLEEGEALQREIRHFIDCVATGRQPLTDDRAGLRVVQILETAQRSVERRGAPVALSGNNGTGRARGRRSAVHAGRRRGSVRGPITTASEPAAP